MSKLAIEKDLDRMLIDIEVQEACNLVVDFILKDQKFKEGKESAYGYWSGLDEDGKIDVIRKALTR